MGNSAVPVAYLHRGGIAVSAILRKALIALSICSGCLLVLILAGFWMGYRAAQQAEMMRSHPFINNDRCLEKMRALPEPGGGFAFAVVGDIQREINKLSVILDSLKKGPPVDFIIQTGDAAAHADSGHYRLFLNELAKCSLEVPFFVVPGNHDVKSDHENLFGTYFGAREFWFEYGNALFIVADTTSGGWDDGKSDWLRTVLESRRAGNRHAFLFMHQLPMERGRHEALIECTDGRLRKLIEAYNVDYVFSGHRHEYSREKWHATTFILNGEDDDFDTHKTGAPFCYNFIRVGTDAVEVRREMLQPYYTLLVASDLKDMYIAHLGDYLMSKPLTGLGMMLFAALGVAIPLLVRSKLASAARQKALCQP
jgi:predicted phosphodiesterase